MTPLVVRREAPADVDAIREVHDAAFGGTWESRLVDTLRGTTSWIPALSLVAEVGGAVVGHVLVSRGHLLRDGRATPVRALGLAPLGVLPHHQGLRIGSSLMYAAVGAAEALDEQVVCLLGNPAYYSRFGFVLASEVGITAPVPDWTPHFQTLVLSAGRGAHVDGEFRYDPAFDAP